MQYKFYFIAKKVFSFNSIKCAFYSTNMKSIWGCILKLLFISFFISSLLHASPEIKTTTPARGIYIPIFSNNGERNYEIIGASGGMIDDDVLLISNATLHCFSSRDHKQVTVTSSSANILRLQNLMYGDGPVFITGENFTAVATDWKFFYEGKKFIADKNVKVLFEENAAEFLTP